MDQVCDVGCWWNNLDYIYHLNNKQMKKLTYLLAVFALALFASCDTNESEIPTRNKMGVYEIAIIDSCEYVSVKRGYGLSMVHHANCQFCRERNNPPRGEGDR